MPNRDGEFYGPVLLGRMIQVTSGGATDVVQNIDFVQLIVR